MAWLFKQARSPFWWVGYRDPISGKVVRESTGFRIGIGEEYGKARACRAALAAKESECASVKVADRWDAWVPAYLSVRYAAATRTYERIQHNWRFMSLYLDDNQIAGPQQLTRQHCLNYVPWRRRKNRSQGFNGVSHNTALHDLKLLSVLMGEAVRRGIVQFNPCRDLEIRKTTPKPKPELSDGEVALIRTEIAKRIEKQASDDFPYALKFDWGHFLRVSFEIALAQGCRLSETLLDVHRDIDTVNMTIRFHAKGDKYYETALNPVLVPLFQELRQSGRRMTFDPPKQRSMLSLVWKKFLKRIGLPHLCFHCTRVTAISRLERAGAPEPVVMQLVGHASTTVHRIYRRVSAKELARFWQAAPVDQPASATCRESSERPGSPSATP